MHKIIKDKTGRPEAIVRRFADRSERLCDVSGNPIATYVAARDATTDRSGNIIARTNRLLSLLPPRN